LAKKAAAFLRNSFHCGGLHEFVSQLFRASTEAFEETASILLFIIGGPWVLIRHAIPEGVVKEHGELACRGGDRFGFAHACRQPSIEGPQRRLRLAHVDGCKTKGFSGAIRGSSGFGTQHLPPGNLVAGR
jgi:hypothetical protein